MYAVEFQTTVSDDTIKIPKEYHGRFRSKVRVIVLSEEQKVTNNNFIDGNLIGDNFIDALLNNPLPIKDFQPLGREEIYAR